MSIHLFDTNFFKKNYSYAENNILHIWFINLLMYIIHKFLNSPNLALMLNISIHLFNLDFKAKLIIPL